MQVRKLIAVSAPCSSERAPQVEHPTRQPQCLATRVKLGLRDGELLHRPRWPACECVGERLALSIHLQMTGRPERR